MEITPAMNAQEIVEYLEDRGFLLADGTNGRNDNQDEIQSSEVAEKVEV